MLYTQRTHKKNLLSPTMRSTNRQHSNSVYDQSFAQNIMNWYRYTAAQCNTYRFGNGQHAQTEFLMRLWQLLGQFPECMHKRQSTVGSNQKDQCEYCPDARRTVIGHFECKVQHIDELGTGQPPHRLHGQQCAKRSSHKQANLVDDLKPSEL